MSDSEEQFSYNEDLLYLGNYHDWFWQGLDAKVIEWLDSPAKVPAPPEPEPIYKNQEFPQAKRWRDNAACAGADPVVFFGVEGADLKAQYSRPDAEWRRFCPKCPVREECLDLARKSKSVGIFGGKFFTYKNMADTQLEYDDATMPKRGRPRKAAKTTAERSKDWRDRVRNAAARESLSDQ